MAVFQWNEKLSVGVQKFDDQHKRLVQMVNELQEAMLASKGREASKKVLDQLVQYTVTHFKDEESAMAAAKFPGLAQHKIEHEKLCNQVLDYKKRVDGGDLSVTVELLKFLRGWLVDHITKTDMAYGVHLNGVGVR